MCTCSLPSMPEAPQGQPPDHTCTAGQSAQSIDLSAGPAPEPRCAVPADEACLCTATVAGRTGAAAGVLAGAVLALAGCVRAVPGAARVLGGAVCTLLGGCSWSWSTATSMSCSSSSSVSSPGARRVCVGALSPSGCAAAATTLPGNTGCWAGAAACAGLSGLGPVCALAAAEPVIQAGGWPWELAV